MSVGQKQKGPKKKKEEDRGPRLSRQEAKIRQKVNPSLRKDLDSLRRYAIAHRIVPPRAVDPGLADEKEIARAYRQIFEQTQFLEGLFNASYPFAALPSAEHRYDGPLDDGKTLYHALDCLSCHAFGDQTAPGANPSTQAW